jgi:hypothetical protein
MHRHAMRSIVHMKGAAMQTMRADCEDEERCADVDVEQRVVVPCVLPCPVLLMSESIEDVGWNNGVDRLS